MEKHFVGFKTINGGYIANIEEYGETINLDFTKQMYFSYFSNNSEKFKNIILKEKDKLYSFSSLLDMDNYKIRNNIKHSFVAEDNSICYIDEKGIPSNLKLELARKNIQNIEIKHFNTFFSKDINQSLEEFINKTDFVKISHTFDYVLKYENKENEEYLFDKLYKNYPFSCFLLADKIAILSGTANGRITNINIMDEKMLPKEIQELLKDFNFNDDFLYSIANFNSDFSSTIPFQKNLIKNTNNKNQIDSIEKMYFKSKNITTNASNSLFDENELEPTINTQNHNYDQIMEKRLRR